jgi:hypothetical protein
MVTVLAKVTEKTKRLSIILLLKNYKKSLKIPKGRSESVNRRRTDNTMAKRKKDKQ